MSTTIAIANQKGGVGKTCTTLNLGIGLALKGKEVLLIDLDPQANLTMSLGWTNPDEQATTISTLLHKTANEQAIEPGEGILRHPEGVDLIPSSIQLSGYEANLLGEFGRESVLRQYIDGVRPLYDYILIDCMPSLNILTINALVAADSVLIPAQPQFFSTAGLQMLFQTIHRVQRKLNPELRIEGVLVTMMDKRPLFSRDLVDRLRENYGAYIKVFDTEIPTSIRMTESSSKGKSIFQYEPNGRLAVAYEKLTQEVLDIAQLHPFADHPFHPYTDERLRDLTDSIREHGVLMPVLVRPMASGGYEIISGHNRVEAAKLAGLDKVPVTIREMDDDLATIAMVDSNLRQRDILLPSEKAWAYRMKMEAMRRQSGRPRNNCAQVGPNFGKRTRDLIAEEMGESKNQISRYIRLTELIPPLLAMIDQGHLPFNPAVELSYLSPQNQTSLLAILERDEITPSLAQAQNLHKLSTLDKLDESAIKAILLTEPILKKKVTLKVDRIAPYFPRGTNPEEMEAVILRLLASWQRNRELRKAQENAER